MGPEVRLVVYALIALGVSFWCSVAEAVLLSVTPSYVVAHEQHARRFGALLRRLKENIDRPIAGILSLNTIAHTVGAVGVGSVSSDVFGPQYVGLTSVVLTVLILVLSEIIPKTIGAVYWRSLAPGMGVVIQIWSWMLFPLVILSEKITNLLSRDRGASVFRREEFKALAEVGAEEGGLAVRESRILQNLFRLRSLRIKDIMTPRTVVFALSRDQSVDEALQARERLPFSRIPVYRETPDALTGFVVKHDLFLASAEGAGSSKLAEYERTIHMVPESATIYNAFESMLDRRQHILGVVDEYGGVEGIVTLEDLVETLLGQEIVDEDDTSVDMQALARARRRKIAERLGVDPDSLSFFTESDDRE